MNPTRLTSIALCSLFTVLAGQALPSLAQQAADAAPLDLKQYLSPRESEMLIVIRRYQADRDKLSSFYAMGGGGGGGRRGGGGARAAVPTPMQYARMKKFGTEWLTASQKVSDSKLSEAAKGDKQKLIDEIKRDLAQLETVAMSQAEVIPAIPFAPTIIGLEETRRKMQKPDAEKAAGTVHQLSVQISEARRQMEIGSSDNTGGIRVSKAVAKRAADEVTTLRGTLRSWNTFYSDYDPLFTWWMAHPYKEADKSLGEYADYLREKGGRDDVSGTITTMPPNTPALPAGKYSDVPDLNDLMAYPQSEMRGVVQYIQSSGGGGRGGGRRGGGGGGAATARRNPDEWLAALAKLDFNGMSRAAQVDYLLLKNRFENQKLLATGSARDNLTEESAKFLPFEAGIVELARKQEEKPNALEAVSTLTALKKQIEDAQKTATADLNGNDPARANRAAAGQAARNINSLQTQLKEWHDRNVGVDAKWGDVAGEPYKAVDTALESYSGVLRAQPGGAQRDGSDIVGRPIGREALMNLLQGEMIVYTPDELIARGEKEFAWCIAEMKKASRQMGYGDDWKKALEKVKDDHPPAGDQPYMIRDLMFEAIDYLRKNDLITVPVVDAETLQMEMMSPERQLVNPFFTGGALISVSYPTSTMSHDAKEQSMRGNNRHFARATVFHELIPGHNMQGFISSRYSTYRSFGTPFWGEGWACYWELLFYEKGFPQSPENKIGMLFWRLHRCARIVFSLKFHMGQWTPKQCIDYLVDGVGHERDNATAEVRRSFGTGYGPLYQAAYLLGALQLLELHKELVTSGKMTERAFHDAIIEGGSMPIAMVRASLIKDKLTPDSNKGWRF